MIMDITAVNMAIELIPAGEPHETILRNLYQFYMYEFSPYYQKTHPH
jgi:hypothetical protein